MVDGLGADVEVVRHAWEYAYISRRLKKRDFRALWIQRINAAARLNDLSYSELIHGLKKAGIGLDRKMLADLAATDLDAFKQIAETAKAAAAA